MVPEFARFLSLALGPMRAKDDDREEHGLLESELLERLHDHRTESGDLALSAANERLEKVSRCRWMKRHGKAFIYLLLPLIMLLFTAYEQAPNYFLSHSIPKWLPSSLKQQIDDRKRSLVSKPLPYHLSPYQENEAVFPIGPQPPLEAMSPSQIQDRILREDSTLRPGNRTLIQDESQKASGPIEAFRKADPDNGWLSYYLASRMTTEIRRSSKDLTKVSEVIKLLKEAIEKPRFVSYTGANVRAQFAAFRLPETHNEASKIEALLYTDDEPTASRRIQDFLDQQASRLIAANQFDQLLELTHLVRKLSILQLVQPGAEKSEYTSFQNFTLNFGLRAKDPQLNDATTAWSDFQAVRKKGRIEVQKLDSIWRLNPEKEVSDNLVSGAYPAHYSNTFIPAYFQGQAVLAHRDDAFRMAWVSYALLFLSFIATAVLRQRRNRLWLAGRLFGVYSWRSSVGVLLVGFLLPLTAWWIQIWYTRLGWGDLGIGFVIIRGRWSFPWLGQFLAAPLAVWLCSLQWAKRQKARHFSFLGPPPRFLLLGWIPAILSVALPGLYGMARFFPTHLQDWTTTVAAIHGMLIIWLIWEVFGPKSATLDSFLVNGMVAPAIAAVSIAASLGVFLTTEEEHQAMHQFNQYRAETQVRNDANAVEKARIWREIFADEFR